MGELNKFYPEHVSTILETHDMTEKNTAILRNYFMNPQKFDQGKKTIVFSTPSTK